MPLAGPRAAKATPAFAIAPRRAEAANSRRAERTSGRLPSADTSVPTTKPSWTASVSQAPPDSERPHSARSAGATAEPENQSDIARSSAEAMRTRARQRRGDSEVCDADAV